MGQDTSVWAAGRGVWVGKCMEAGGWIGWGWLGPKVSAHPTRRHWFFVVACVGGRHPGCQGRLGAHVCGNGLGLPVREVGADGEQDDGTTDYFLKVSARRL